MTPAAKACDFATVLTCAPGRRCAKRYRSANEAPDDFDAGLRFEVYSVPVESLQDLAELLEALRTDPTAMIIRGRLRADAPRAPEGYLRRCLDRPGEPAPFERAPHRWVMLDVDKSEEPFDPSDPAGSVERWRATLPEGLRTAACVFQISASQHRKATLRGHAWVWLAEPASDLQLRAWASRNGFDPAVFNPVQPHYTADPVFAEGLADPLAPRALVCLPGVDAELELPAEDELADRNASRMRALETLGDIDPSPEAAAKRAAVVKPLAAHFRTKGKKWSLCGAVGGACAKAGLPPAEAAEIVAMLLDEATGPRGDDPECDVDAGVMWALGAYELEDPSKATGVGEIARLTQRADGRPSIVARDFAAALERFAPAPAAPGPEGEGEAEGESDPLAALGLVLLEGEPAPLEYVWGPFAAGKVSAIVGYAYNGKTPFALALGLHIAAGREFLGQPTQQRNVLYFAFEGARNAKRKERRIARALAAAGGDLEALADTFQFRAGSSGMLDAESVAAIESACEAVGAGVVIVDTYGSALDPAIDRNAAAFSAQLKQLGDWSDRTGVLVIVLLHTRKNEKNGKAEPLSLQMIDGHNSAAGALQAAVGLSRPNPEDETLFSVACLRAPDEAFEPFALRWEDVTPEGKAAETAGARAAAQANGGLRAVLVSDAQREASEAAALAERIERLTGEVVGVLAALAPDGAKVAVSQAVSALGKRSTDARAAIERLIREGRIGADYDPGREATPGLKRRQHVWLLGQPYSAAPLQRMAGASARAPRGR